MNRAKNFLRGYSLFTTGNSHSTPAPHATHAAEPHPARVSTPPQASLSRLSHALIAKSLVEVLFVVALAVYFSYTSFNPYFRGSVDAADARTVAGWVVNEATPDERVEVHLYIDGHFVSRRLADAPRPDVFQARRSSNINHGFVFNLPPLPPGRTYEARVYAMHATGDAARRALQEFGEVRRFSVETNGANASVPERWWESEARP